MFTENLKYPTLITTILLFILIIMPLHAENNKYPNTLNNKRLSATISIGATLYAAEIYYLQYVWYKDHDKVPFHWYNDNKGYNQMDKFGHTFGSYIESYYGYTQLRKSGVSKNKALLYGGTLGLMLQTPIEIFDGLYEGYGFSWGDMGANALGSLFVIGQEHLFNEQVVKMKFSFRRSPYAKEAPKLLGYNQFESLALDYNGQTYWFSINMNKIIPSDKIPSWLSLAIGYGAGGMFGEFKNRKWYKGKSIPDTERYRQYYLSLDIDCSKIKTNNIILKSIFEVFRFIKVPAPAIEYNTKRQFKAHYLHF